MMVEVPKEWVDWSNTQKKAWADENGLLYNFRTTGLEKAVKSKNSQDDKEKIEDLESRLENATVKLTMIAEQRFAEKLKAAGNPVGITTPEGLKDYVEAQRNSGGDPIIGKGGSGTISLDSQGGNGSDDESFEDEKEMIDTLRNRASLGDKQSKLILAKLFYKVWSGRRESPRMMSAEFSGKIDPLTGREQGIISRLTEDYRKREKMKRECKDE